MSPSRPACLLCRHFALTSDPERPRSCRAFAFRSWEYPSAVVLATSGEECKLYDPKKPRRPEHTLP